MKRANSTEAYRATMLLQTAKWMEPPTACEFAMVEEIEALDRIRVEMLAETAMARLGMQPMACHKNCRDLVQFVEGGSFIQIVGWKVERGLYILHSIVETPVGRWCVTPTLGDTDGRFDFIPDAAILQDDCAPSGFKRKGIDVPAGLRADPYRTIELMKDIRQGLASDQDPREVMANALDFWEKLVRNERC